MPKTARDNRAVLIRVFRISLTLQADIKTEFDSGQVLHCLKDAFCFDYSRILEDVPKPDITLVCCGGGNLLVGTAAAMTLHCQTTCTVYGVEPETGKYSFAHNKKFVDEILLVSDSEIISAVKHLYNAGLKVEPSGAAAFSALMHHNVPDLSGKTVVVVIRGGNVSPEELVNVFKM
ncbi:uncharacterized protein [Antedon mediterranea]|uniref:uncharacterized protein n=1 Tax=Antedon mediterranea TaxID=105859 RepID=UPI003AF64573